MFEVIYIKADYEPWWMFEDWEEMIRSRRTFDDVTLAQEYCEGLLAELRGKHESEAMRQDCFFAFWSNNEQCFCEGCDEDLQLYHGVILMADGKPQSFLCRSID